MSCMGCCLPMLPLSGQARLRWRKGCIVGNEREATLAERGASPGVKTFLSSLKTERAARKVYRTREQARADVFDYIGRFHNPTRRHSTLGYVCPIQLEKAQNIQVGVHETGGSPDVAGSTEGTTMSSVGATGIARAV